MRYPVFIASVFSALACTPHAASSPMLGGSVMSEQGAAVPFARVTVAGAGDTHADAQGTFAVPAPSDQPTALTVSAPGFASRTQWMPVGAMAMQTNLRPLDRAMRIPLPTEGNTSYAIVRGDGQVTLTLVPGHLVTAMGHVAMGDANMQFTYWHPLEDERTVPADLQQPNPRGGAPQALSSFGTVAVTFEQDGQMLHIATGETLPMSFTMPHALQKQMQRPNAPLPGLYALNTQTGLWNKQGSVAQGNVACSDDFAAISAQLPQLGAWSLAVDATAVMDMGNGLPEAFSDDLEAPQTP